MHFGDAEGRVLHGLIEDAMDDIVVRLDGTGFITYASANACELGIDLDALLLMPHISDLADPDYAAEILRGVREVLEGRSPDTQLEFPLRPQAEEDGESATNPPRLRRWYSISLRAIAPDDGATQGALGLLRSVQHKHVLGGPAPVDPYTGLPGRQVFCGNLSRVLGGGDPHCMAVFAVDQMRAIFMQYGQATADEIRWGFARFLDTMTHSEQEVAHLDDERFGVLLPGLDVKGAREWASEVLQTFSDLTATAVNRNQELSASAGIARVENSVDWILRQAELGLVMARAGGGMQVGLCKPSPYQPSTLANGAAVERAMEAAIQRATQRQH